MAEALEAKQPNRASNTTAALTTAMLLTRAPPPPLSAASFPTNPERVLLPCGQASFRTAVAIAAASVKATSLRAGQKPKQVTSVANPLVKHCVKLRLSAAYRRSCRRLLLVGLAPIL
jgi:RNA methyltransferase, TrmH family